MNVAEILADPQYGALKDHVLRHTGLSYYADKDEDFAMRLSRRILARAISDCAAYLRLLNDVRFGRQEMDQLVGELTIGETYFFRHREHFELLRSTIIPDLLERNQATKSLRIWSAGCATGAEPYSVSLLLQSQFRAQLAGWNVSIVATDLNLDFLERARAAKFAEWALRETPETTRQRCFVREGNSWQLRQEFTRGVTFRYHNLAGGSDLSEGPGAFDLILCRNVIIYFSREQAMTTLALLKRHMAPRGWLLVGYAEPNMEMFKSFEAVTSADSTAYRNPAPDKAVGPGHTAWLPPSFPDVPILARSSSPPRPQIDSEIILRAIQQPAPTVDEVRMLADTGHWDAASRLTERLIQTDSLNPGSHFISALIHEHLGASDKALVALRRAIYLDRRFALAHYHLATSLANVNQMESASRSFQNTLEILTTMADDEPLPHGDSITAGELRTLTNMHLEMGQR